MVKNSFVIIKDKDTCFFSFFCNLAKIRKLMPYDTLTLVVFAVNLTYLVTNVYGWCGLRGEKEEKTIKECLK